MEVFTKKELQVLNYIMENQNNYKNCNQPGILDSMIEDLAVKTKLPVRNVRSVIDGLITQRFVEQDGKLYFITDNAKKYLPKLQLV